ncbi:MAG: hypothetical protein Q8P46_12040 [Hyphomicrobiales bacterium]|jgi:hypothetical protein|nr:hypothetical protein [Hyphomicrobiales bacterium]
MLLGIPLLVLPLIAYNVLTFVTEIVWSREVIGVNMVSGARWVLTVEDLFITVALLLLFVEILKATRTGFGSVFDHAMSTLVFIVCLVEFLVVPQAATSVYFLMTAIALIDVVAGYSVTIRAARRDFAVDHYPPGSY